MNKRINYKNLNDLIKIGKTILRILLVCLICSLVAIGIFFIEKIHLLDTIITIIKITGPLFLGLAISWLFEPLIEKIEKKKVNRLISSLIVYIGLIVAIILVLLLVTPEFVSQLKELINNVPIFLDKVEDFLTSILSKFKGTGIDISSIKESLSNSIAKLIEDLTTDNLSGIIDGLTSFLSSSFNILLGLLIGFYFSLDYKKITSWIHKIIPSHKEDKVVGLLDKLNKMTRGYVSGTLLTSLIVAFLTFLGLIISGVSSPLLFALFCGITNIIPYFGPYIGGVPVIIVGYSISPLCGTICLITILVVQVVEGNIINPIVVGEATDMHPITILIALLIFEYYFGIVGMILSTPVVGAVKILILYFDENYHIIDRLRIRKLEKDKVNKKENIKDEKELLEIKKALKEN